MNNRSYALPMLAVLVCGVLVWLLVSAISTDSFRAWLNTPAPQMTIADIVVLICVLSFFMPSSSAIGRAVARNLKGGSK